MQLRSNFARLYSALRVDVANDYFRGADAAFDEAYRRVESIRERLRRSSQQPEHGRTSKVIFRFIR